MTTRFFAGEETVQVDLGDGFFVELKRELDFGEESELEGAAVRAALDADGTPRLDFSLREQRSLMLALYIVSWNLAGSNGRVVPLPDDVTKRRSVVTSLRPSWAKRLIAEIEEIRAAEGAPMAIRLDESADGENPTSPGAESAPGTPSSSPSGLAAATTT